MPVNRIDPTPVRLDTKITEARQTPNDSFGSRITAGAAAAGNAIANGAAIAAPFVPGGAIVSAAVSGVSSLSSSASSGQSAVGGGMGGIVGASYDGAAGFGTGGATVPTAPGGSASIPSSVGGGDSSTPGISLSNMYQQQMNLLAMQTSIQQQSQSYEALSNVLKVRHDTAKNSISNIH